MMRSHIAIASLVLAYHEDLVDGSVTIGAITGATENDRWLNAATLVRDYINTEEAAARVPYAPTGGLAGRLEDVRGAAASIISALTPPP